MRGFVAGMIRRSPRHRGPSFRSQPRERILFLRNQAISLNTGVDSRLVIRVMKGLVMRIGELSRRSGVTIDTLRYYDRIGLVRPSGRNQVSRFRDYGPEAVEELSLVRTAKLGGLSLPQIRKILSAARSGRACREVVPLLGDKIREIDQAIRSLSLLRERLKKALKTKSPGKGAGRSCPILLGLSKSARMGKR